MIITLNQQADMNMANNNFLAAFFKISIITTLFFGGLLAQSYATNLVTDSIIKMNIEFTANNDENANHQTASVNVQNNQQSDFTFGNHHVEIKTIFVKKDGVPVNQQQFLAEVKIKQLGESGQFELIGSPTMLILRNKWAEFKLNTEEENETIQFKLQYEEDKDMPNDNAFLTEPIWLNWGDKQPTTEVC